MFTRTLSQDATGALALLGESGIFEDAYLAGGTACALQVGHRISLDLDFFTEKEFNTEFVLKSLKKLPGFKLDETAKWTILGSFPKVKFSYFYYPYPLIKKTATFSKISLASLEDIAAMKILAISSRGTKRDFIDLFFLAKQFSLVRMLKFYDQKYGNRSNSHFHIFASLNYFDDAESQPSLKMIKKVSWDEVKEFFRQEVKRIAKKSI